MERLTCSLMMHGRNNGKKLMAIRIVKHAFEIIHLLTGEVRDVHMLSTRKGHFFCRTHFKFWLTQLSTVDREKTPHALAGQVQLGDKQLTFLR